MLLKHRRRILPTPVVVITGKIKDLLLLDLSYFTKKKKI